jgi:cardiolipin synthase
MPDGSDSARLNGAAGARATQAGVVTLPNIITFARLCAVPLAVWLVIEERFGQAFTLFVLAGLSDAVDGWLARRQGGGNSVGAVLDPVADKALLVCMYVTLAAVHVLPDWLAILVVFRDVIIVGGVLVCAVLGYPVAIRPLYISKVNTVMQIALVAAALLLAGFGVRVPGLIAGLSWVVAATTLASGAAYVLKGARLP